MKETLVEHSVPDFSNEDWCTGANNWDFDDDSQENISFTVDTEVASVMNRVSIAEEENANVISDNFRVDLRDAMPSAEIEPDENEPITIDTPTMPKSDLLRLLQYVPSSPKVCEFASFILIS